MASSILVIDDDPMLLRVTARFLGEEGYAVRIAHDGGEGLLSVRDQRPDLVLADCEMPGLDGMAFCRALKSEAATRDIPVVLMSGSRIAEREQVAGFSCGADDYVLKPFSSAVLLSRIRAVLRRASAPPPAEHRLHRAGITLDTAARTVTVDGRPVALARKEFDLLHALLSAPGKVLRVNALLEAVWGYDPAVYNNPRTVQVHVSHLRQKLGPRAGKRLVNVLGHGYRFEG